MRCRCRIGTDSSGKPDGTVNAKLGLIFNHEGGESPQIDIGKPDGTADVMLQMASRGKFHICPRADIESAPTGGMWLRECWCDAADKNHPALRVPFLSKEGS